MGIENNFETAEKAGVVGDFCEICEATFEADTMIAWMVERDTNFAMAVCGAHDQSIDWDGE